MSPKMTLPSPPGSGACKTPSAWPRPGASPCAPLSPPAALKQLLAAHGFRLAELLTPADIQAHIIAPTGTDLTAFEHVNYCLAVKF